MDWLEICAVRAARTVPTDSSKSVAELLCAVVTATLLTVSAGTAGTELLPEHPNIALPAPVNKKQQMARFRLHAFIIVVIFLMASPRETVE